jgi:hypothetical protein
MYGEKGLARKEFGVNLENVEKISNTLSEKITYVGQAVEEQGKVVVENQGRTVNIIVQKIDDDMDLDRKISNDVIVRFEANQRKAEEIISNQVTIHQDIMNKQDEMKEELANISTITSEVAQILSKAIDSVKDEISNTEMKIDELEKNVAEEFNEMKMSIGYFAEAGVEAMNKSKKQTMEA